MPRKGIVGFWVATIHELAESEPRPSAAQIELRLKKIGDQEGRDDCPSLRTIGRILQEHGRLPEREKEFYREFRWPQAMQADLVPWEATRVALDLLAYYLRKHKVRPTVRRVLWHWRLSLVNPDWEIGHRDVYVTLISAALDSPRPISIRYSADELAYIDLGGLSPQELDIFLMDEPWKDDIQESRYYAWEIDDDDQQGLKKEG